MIATTENPITKSQKMNISVQGHKVVLLFSEKPNHEIAARVKQALLGAHMLVAK